MRDQLRVVIAEHDTERRASISRLLSVHKGWTIHVANDQIELLSLATADGVDAVVMENLFPGTTMESIVMLRSSCKSAHLPILVVYGSVGPQAKELMEVGASDVVGPPAGGREITKVIRTMLANPQPISYAPRSVIRDVDRITALIETNLLDSGPKKQFEMVSHLTMKILGVPVALISLVDEDRQYFLSQHGLVEPWATQRETPLSHSFCQWVVSAKEPLVIEDARKVPVLVNNMAIRDLGVVAYAGQPITADGEAVIGALCAIDGHPRSWTFDELATLKDLADLTECYIAFEKQGFDPAKDSSRPAESNAIGNLDKIHIEALGIEAISRLLQRAGLPITAGQRRRLMSVVQTFSNSQSRLSSFSWKNARFT